MSVMKEFLQSPALMLWSKLSRHRPAPAGPKTPAPTCESEDQIPILLALARQSDVEVLRTIFNDSRYVAVVANGIDHACKVASHIVFPVVLYDPFLDPAERQIAFRRMVGGWRAPSIIVVCDSEADCPQESQQEGDFATLCRPLGIQTTIAALDFAFQHWKSKPLPAPEFSRSARPAVSVWRASTRV